MNTISNSNTKGNNINQKIDPLVIATNFVNYYYQSIDKNPNGLINNNGEFIYKEKSEYCIQGQIIKGQTNIFNRLVELNRRGSSHKINSIDVITSGSRRLNILACGQIQLDGFLYNFTEYFHLANGKKSDNWWIQSSIIRTI